MSRLDEIIAGRRIFQNLPLWVQAQEAGRVMKLVNHARGETKLTFLTPTEMFDWAAGQEQQERQIREEQERQEVLRNELADLINRNSLRGSNATAADVLAWFKEHQKELKL